VITRKPTYVDHGDRSWLDPDNDVLRTIIHTLIAFGAMATFLGVLSVVLVLLATILSAPL
jgi:hypothetical protein